MTLTMLPRTDASAPESAPVSSNDQLNQRLLRNRIVFLEQGVDDDISNRVRAELFLPSGGFPS